MATNGTHYEQAFAGYLAEHGINHVPIDQHHKALLAGEKLKSFDFIVYASEQRKILVDVKGRKLERKSFERGRYDQNWVTADDITGLQQWSEQFGAEYIAALVFAYWVQDDGDEEPWPFAETERFAERDYHFVAVELNAYRRVMRRRSEAWDTVHVPSKQFAQMAQPLLQFLKG
ncbi:MAG: HYExAFE family protein [Sedimentisphaerales bacterium]|nr:HYExAFE family protein [Sedimentisphaerales bacterium]